MLNFISLGSGSSGNCYYLNCDGYGIVIDLGIGIRLFKKHFSNYGLSIAQIKAIIATHDHTDHVKAVGVLSQTFKIPVYTTQKVHDSIKVNHYISKKIPKELQMVVTHHDTFELGPFKITPFLVPHDSAENNGYIIHVEDKVFVIMTDIGHFTEEMIDIVHNATHLIIESNYDERMLETGKYPLRLKKRISSPYGHISNAETADFLAKNLNPQKIKQVWLCHLSAENNIPRIAYETVTNTLIKEGFVLDKEHLQVNVLSRKTPSLLTQL